MRVSNLGELSMSHYWYASSDRGERLFSVLLAATVAAFVLFVIARGVQGNVDGNVDLAEPLTRLGFAGVVGVALVTYWYCQPTRYAIFVGELGVMHTRRGALSSTTTGLMFHAAARAEVELERVISDSAYLIYAHTNLTFTWFDEGNAPVFVHTATVLELDQQGDWTTRNELDPTALENLPPDHPAVFGYAALAAFHTFRQRAPYR